MGTKLWDIWAYFRSTEMNTPKRFNENEFRSQHCLTKREGRLINIHLKPIKLPNGQFLGMKIPVTVRNVIVHLWSIWKVDIETCVCEKKKQLIIYGWFENFGNHWKALR